MQRLIHTTWDLDKDSDREKKGFNITLCPVHTTQGQAQGTIVFYCVSVGRCPCPGPDPVQCV